MIYLDAAATTKPRNEVVKAMKPYMELFWMNPSSLYKQSVSVKKEIEKSRQTIANFINAEPEEIIFTSGGSESNCMAIQGFISKCRCSGLTPTIITSTIEHKSILLCVDTISEDSYYVGVNKEGIIQLDVLESILQKVPKHNKILVSIQYANNEIGTIQNIKDIASMVHRYGGVFHTDAVQAFGHEIIDVKDLDVDMLSASGHKIGMVKGSGFLYKKKDIEIKPIIYGTQEFGLRGGTENVPYIIGLAKAVELIQKDKESRFRVQILRDTFITELKAMGCRLNGSYMNRLANNINVTFPEGISGESLIYMMDASNICISAGSACNSHSQVISHVLEAIGLSNDEALRTVRITLPDNITADNIDYSVSEFKKSIKILGISV